jgi:hypothetical protein
MRSDIAPGGTLPDYELPDPTRIPRRLSELQGDDPLILTLARGQYCPNSPPGAGIAVHVRGDCGRLAAVRLYGDVDPPLSRHLQANTRIESRDAQCMSR